MMIILAFTTSITLISGSSSESLSSCLIDDNPSAEFLSSKTKDEFVTRLREYQGVDPHFDTIARQYHDIVKKLENMQWTIHQVEMDLKRFPDHPSTT
ncbi:hypothetical protein OROHE_012647 [Orobanche hederae]